MKLKSLSALLLLPTLMLLLVGCGGGVSGAISVKDLLKEFQANAVVAEEKYKGKDLLIEGKNLRSTMIPPSWALRATTTSD